VKSWISAKEPPLLEVKPGDLQEKMNVVVSSANRMNENRLVFAYTPKVRPEPLLMIFRNELLSLFCAEHDADEILGIGMRQSVMPSQSLRTGLTSRRAYGAEFENPLTILPA
jgi:hypothetical protein